MVAGWLTKMDHRFTHTLDTAFFNMSRPRKKSEDMPEKYFLDPMYREGAGRELGFLVHC